MGHYSDRVVITTDCLRDCELCCNKTQIFKDNVKELKSLMGLEGYREICVTGGEPMLCPEYTLMIIDKIREILKYNVKIYLYIAKYSPILQEIIPLIDGINYSVHSSVYENDRINLTDFQLLIERHPEKSFRLFLENEVNNFFSILPKVWDKIIHGPMIPECPIPEHEDLYIYKPEL